MPLLLLLVLLLFLAPWLGLIVLVLSFFLVLFVIPFGFALRSLFWLFAGPRQLLAVFFNARIRRNHALEHATAHVLEEAAGPSFPLSGYAVEDGFFVDGPFQAATVFAAAREALRRLEAGEADLALHRRCGTTVVVVNLVASVAFLLILWGTGHLSLLAVIVALVVANGAGPLLSGFVQRHLTTDADVKGMEVLGVEVRSGRSSSVGVFLPFPSRLFVVTRQPGQALKAEVIR